MATTAAVVAIFHFSADLAHGERANASDTTHRPAAQADNFGRPGVAKKVTRVVSINLSDAMRFSPDTLTFQRGDTARLHIVNAGKLAHEFVLGSQAEISEHAAMMRQMPDMVHADASSVRVAPGKSADIVWQFSASGKFIYACLIPGHLEAGMQGSVTVVDPAHR
jgi:uncharacterized cupredoxin-like copper-binding protein